MPQPSRSAAPSADIALPKGLELRSPIPEGCETILTAEALGFVAMLVRRFEPRRRELLARREAVQARFDAGERPAFPPAGDARRGDWRAAPIPQDLRDRRVEITGPVDRKMIINALNSGANVFMADFEDATSPTWANLVEGQRNLYDAVRREIDFTSPEGKEYRLGEQVATLVVRPRGWHLDERHFIVDGAPASGSLFDFGLFLFHNAREQLARGTGPYFYLPKLENSDEARLWNDVFVAAQEAVGVPHGSIRATVLIETITAAFELDEILWELRDHSAGLNCGRWDYIFSFIKKFRNDAAAVLPDRGLVTMDRHFLQSYTRRVVQACHRRGVHAMGGMAAFIPVKGDEAANDRALAKVRADKEREVEGGHDGTWVAHPALVAVAREVFDRGMSGPNQLERMPEAPVSEADLLAVPDGPITEAGVRQNVTVAVRYMAAWLGGRGAVPIFNLMEDAATAEISRSQLWQWVRHGARLDDGRPLTAELYRQLRDDELGALRSEVGDESWQRDHYGRAAELLDTLVLAPDFAEFLTLPAYEVLLELEAAPGAGG